jgi:hypothetical protein
MRFVHEGEERERQGRSSPMTSFRCQQWPGGDRLDGEGASARMERCGARVVGKGVHRAQARFM